MSDDEMYYHVTNLEATTARYRQLLFYENAVTTNDFERCVLKVVNLLASLSRMEVLHAIFSTSIAEEAFTSARAKAAIKVAQALVQLDSNENTRDCLTDLQQRLKTSNTVSKTTTSQCLLELYVLEMELVWRMGKLENMDTLYRKALSMEERALGPHMSSAHGYYGRYLLRCDREAEALDCLVKAVKEHEQTSIADEHYDACVQSLALVAYTLADTSADELLHKYSGRRDVVAIRRFAMAFLREDVDGLERILDEADGAFEDREIWRLLRHYETVLKVKLCLRSSLLPAECWTDVIQCLTHPDWHHLQSLCRKFDPILAPLRQHLHSDVQKATFKWVFVAADCRWQVTLQSKSGRADKVDHYFGYVLGDSLLASAIMQYILIVEIVSVNEVTDEGIVRFCFGRDGRQFEIHQPMVTHRLFARLAEEHSSAANDHEFTLKVTYPSNTSSAFRRQMITTACSQRDNTYEIPSRNTLLIIQIDLDVFDLDTMIVTRKRLTT